MGKRWGRGGEGVVPKDRGGTRDVDVGDVVDGERRDGAVGIRPQACVNRDDGVSAGEARHVKQGAKDAQSGRVVGWERYKKLRALERKSR